MTTSFVPTPAPPVIVAAPDDAADGTDLRRALATVVSALAAGGGLVHLGVVGDHTDYRVVAAGFAAMGVSQLGLALWLFRRPSRRVLLMAAGLHAAIAATWALSRTVGLGFVPGEADTDQVGVADVVANTFSLAVVGTVVILVALHRVGGPIALPHVVARRMTGVAVAGALTLTGIAVSAPHVHASHAPTVETPVVGHSHDGPALSSPGHVPSFGTGLRGAARPHS